MAKAPEKGKGLDLTVVLFAFCGAAVFALVIWIAGHNLFSFLMVRGRQVELFVIGYIIKPFVGENGPLTFARAYAASSTVNLTFESCLQVMRESGAYVRWVYSPILIGLGFYLFQKSPTANFKKSHNTDSLAKQESALWPEIKPALGLNLVRGDITKGPWAVSATEWEYVRRFGLAEFPDANEEEIFTVPGAPRESAAPREQLNVGKARDLFVQQLGPVWRGFYRLPPYAKGIYAALIIRVAAVKLTNTKKKEEQIKRSMDLFRKMATEYAEHKGDIRKMDFSFADNVYKELGNDDLVRLTSIKHAYVFTVFATLLQLSRADGVVASSLFIWLRPVNRRLWFILNCVGGYTFYPEACGIAAHWLTEKEVGVGLLAPSVQEAVIGLESALVQYIEEDENESLFK